MAGGQGIDGQMMEVQFPGHPENLEENPPWNVGLGECEDPPSLLEQSLHKHPGPLLIILGP